MHFPLVRSRRHAAVGAIVAVALPVAVFAGGMAVTMQNGAHLGNAFSGGASAEDASTVFFNPAGLMWLDHPESLVTFTYLTSSGGFTNNGSTTAGVIPTSGADGGTAIANALVPTFYAAYPFSDKIAFGFGLSVPYGLGTDYDAGWVGRYHALKTELQTVNLNPAIAWRPTENVAVGFGFDWQRANATITNAVDFGLVGFANGVPGLLPGGADGGLRVKASDNTQGFNLGVLFNVAGSGRLGVHYRSRMAHVLEGSATFSGVPAPFAPLFPNQDVTAPLTLPERLSVSFYYYLTPTLALMADWSWWKWSRFQTLAIDFANPATPDAAIPQNWNNASIYSAGVRWAQSQTLTLRAGLALNESPVSSAAERSPRIPDSDRVWICAGASWRFADNLRGDLGLAHLSFKDSTTLNDDGLGHVLRGNFSIGVTIVSAQFTYGF